MEKKAIKRDDLNSMAEYFGINPNELSNCSNELRKLRLLSPDFNEFKFENTSESLKFLLHKSGMTPHLLYLHTGIATHIIETVLKNEKTSLSVENLSVLANFFNLTIEQLNGKEVIPGNKEFSITPNYVHVPLLKVNDVSEWLNGKEVPILCYIQSARNVFDGKVFAVKFYNNAKPVTYIFQSAHTYRNGDIMIVKISSNSYICEIIDSIFYNLHTAEKVDHDSNFDILGVAITQVFN